MDNEIGEPQIAAHHPKRSKQSPRWMFFVLWFAAIYNLAWGGWVVLFPNAAFRILAMPAPNYPQIWQCVGMIVGVYGVGYACAAYDPVRHWPIVLVGLLGKLLGPVGFLSSALRGELPWRFGLLNIANDFIWWAPFGLILYHSYKAHMGIHIDSPKNATHQTN